jgi:hypothetical protein
MLGRYKKRILRLVDSLRRLECESENVEALVTLQGELVWLIKRTESRIAELRDGVGANTAQLKGGRHPKQESNRLKKLIDEDKKRIDEYQYLKFIWKCFGDGIAFIYLDKFSLKHAFYDTTDYLPKQDAGALSGKEGLKREWAIVKKLAKNGMPAMLCDITNILRHGDVCGLLGPDPMPVEIKSSKNINERGKRQLQRIGALMNFYKNDEARNFRGIPYVRRSVFSPQEITHLDVMNECIARSEGNAAATMSPEPGLHYYCIRDAEGLSETDALTPESIMCLLNEAKRERSWMPFFPFTLSIRDAKHLYEFIRGDFTLAVVLERAELVKQFAADGIRVVLSNEGDWAIWMRRRGSTGTSAVSQQMFGRMFYEFQSLAWFVAAHGKNALQIDEDLGEQAEQMASGTRVPDVGWLDVIPESVLRILDDLDSEPKG